MNEDEILGKIMKHTDAPYIADDGFTMRVVGALPGRGISPSTRRLALIAAGTLAGCLSAVALSWSGLASLPGRLAAIAPSIQDALTGQQSVVMLVVAASLLVSASLCVVFRGELS